MKKLRVLVFGTTGIGKTSLCNSLTGRNRPTGGGAKGMTAKSHQYAPFEVLGDRIELVDTVGLHESNSGTVPAEKAVLQLVELLESARSGFNLLIHVTRASRITKDFEDDHNFFVVKMTEGKIPVLLVVTGCENEHPMQAWVDKNRPSFDSFGYREILATCFAEGGPLETHYGPLREQSRGLLLEQILRLALQQPVRLYGRGTGNTFSQLLTRMWNTLVDTAGLPKEYRRELNESAFSLMKRMGVPEKIAQMAIKHIPDLIEEVANKAPMPGTGKVARKVTEMILGKILPRRP